MRTKFLGLRDRSVFMTEGGCWRFGIFTDENMETPVKFLSKNDHPHSKIFIKKMEPPSKAKKIDLYKHNMQCQFIAKHEPTT